MFLLISKMPAVFSKVPWENLLETQSVGLFVWFVSLTGVLTSIFLRPLKKLSTYHICVCYKIFRIYKYKKEYDNHASVHCC